MPIYMDWLPYFLQGNQRTSPARLVQLAPEQDAHSNPRYQPGRGVNCFTSTVVLHETDGYWSILGHLYEGVLHLIGEFRNFSDQF